ncbi:LacI family DNA-binding transcriptional regulator [Ekhidna sp.]|jgi:LacI family transcriptional regulator|uniref:LacI family DNA-binding transcriptional regulator n=1 Tax=Ekhidna sp. TaxID=2608089 RepID=UPI0032EBF803
MKRQTTTIKDIARELGISPSTVSRALKDHFEISEETKKAVRRVAEELNYQPNSLALSLRYSKSNTIGVIVPEIVHFFFSTVISGIEDIAQSRGYNVIITQSNESVEREMMNLQTLFNNRVDGILVSLSRESFDYTHFEAMMQKGLPIVFFDRVADTLETSKVTVDDFLGGYQATEHLIKQGYKRIGHLAGPENLDITNQRLNGFRKAHEDAGLAINEELIIFNQASDESDAYNATYEMLKSKNADALFASNDLAAMGAIKAAQKYGKNVPQDFGVVGFSNWQFTALTNPSITTIEQPGFEMGQHAAELLIKQIDGGEEDVEFELMKLPTNLLVRDSSQKV